jgi:hypothetical protein
MNDYFDHVERGLRDAMRRQADASRYVRLRRRTTRPLVLALACLLLAGSALAATGVILNGSPVPVKGAKNPSVGGGVPTPGGSRLLPLRVPDPGGGPPWGIRLVRTTRGLLCLQVARVQDGQLGELGIDGAFHDDGRFHALPEAAAPASDAGLGFGGASPREDTSCHLVGEAFAGYRIGIDRSAGGPINTIHTPRDQLRDLHYGTLGSPAVSVSYTAEVASMTQQVVPGLGAYLIVLPSTARDQLGTAGGAMGLPGGLHPSHPLTVFTYRVNGRTCEAVATGGSTRPCPRPKAIQEPHRPAPAKDLHRPLRVRLRTVQRLITSATVTFTAPFAVAGAGQAYALEIPIARCHSSGKGEGYASQSTNRDIATGSPVSVRIAYPFANACGGRSIEIRVVYQRADSPPVRVGETTLRQPPGTRAAPHRRVARRSHP